MLDARPASVAFVVAVADSGCRGLLAGKYVLRNIEHELNMIIAPVVEQIPHRVLPATIEANDAAVLSCQLEVAPGRHDLVDRDERWNTSVALAPSAGQGSWISCS
ncbi:hypothetical protein PT2222_200174 [Paraburkholderia tropica]